MNNRLYVGNLAFETTQDAIARTFAACGTVVETKLVLDRETARSRGFAFVVMETPDEASKAISELDGRDLDGRSLRVTQAFERNGRPGASSDFHARSDRERRPRTR